MPLQESYEAVLKRLPAISRPVQRLTFREKIRWTLIILLLYVIMAQIQVFGVDKEASQRLRIVEILLGSSFGSLMSLGIGPVVTSSIILQLLIGSKLIPWDLKSEGGRMLFQGTQKILGVVFSFIEAIIFVSFGTIKATGGNEMLVIGQLALGGVLVIFMDELISKWGFGSGISLFIVTGVSKNLLVQSLNPFTRAGTFPTEGNPAEGIIPNAISSLIAGNPTNAFLSLLPLFATVLVFFIVIYINSVKVEIPLAFGMVRGFGRRWPLKFLYTSNIPVILIAALLANIQLLGSMLKNSGLSWLGSYDPATGTATGIIFFLTLPSSNPAINGLVISMAAFALAGIAIAYVSRRSALKIGLIAIVIGILFWFGLVRYLGLTSLDIIASWDANALDVARAFTYTLFLMLGSVVFAYFWMISAGMDSKSVAGQIHSIGMQIPGYRRDVRIIESVLDRYIPALAVLGGATVGFIAAFADLTSAVGTGTGLLLATMIVYQLYEEIAAKHMEDLHPALRRFVES